MNKLLPILVLSFLFSLKGFSQCPPDTAIGLVIPPMVDCFYNDGSNMQDLYVDTTNVLLEGLTTYSLWATRPPNEAGDEGIIRVTYDGIVDYSDGPDVDGDGERDPYPPGEYCFIAVGYNQADIDNITNNESLQGILNAGSDEACIEGDESLADVIDCLANSGGTFSTIDVVTVDTVLSILSNISIFLGYNPCVIMGDRYCVTVANPNECPSDSSLIDGIEEVLLGETTMSLYPNPAQNIANLAFYAETYLYEPISFNVYNLLGQVVYTEERWTEIGLNTLTFEVSDWTTGVYFYSLEMNGQVVTNRMVVDR